MTDALFEKLEWCGIAPISRMPMCPVCHHVKAAGHKPECALAAVHQSDLTLAARLIRIVCGPTPNAREWDDIAEEIRSIAFELKP